MKKILTATLLFIQIHSIAQQCGYDHYYLFPLHIHQAGNNELVKNLKIYLTDENGKAVTAEVLYQEKKIWKTRNDTLLGWVNGSLKKEDGSRPLIRRNFYNIEKVYVVVFRMDISKMKDPLRRPLYRLQIEGGESRDGFRFQSQSVHLPLNKALWLCNNGILDNFPPSIPVEHLDHQPYQPIDIVLQKEEMQMGEDPRATMGPIYQLRPYYEMSTNPAAYNRTERILQGVKVFDTRSGKVQQDIPIRSDVVLFEETYQQTISSHDFYQRSLKEAADFAVLVKRWRDTIFAVERTQTDCYVFNPSKKQYEKDTLLSRYPDTRYYEGLKTFRRIEYLLTPKSTIRNTYELKDTSWKLIDKIEELFPAYQPKVKPTAGACVFFEEKYHRLPVQVVQGTNASIVVRDSFRLYNYCEDTINIVSVKSQHRNFFSVSQTMLPKQYTTLYFEGIVQNSSSDFNTNSFVCYLELEDKTTLSFGIDIPVVSNNSKLAYRTDGSVLYSIAQRPNTRFAKATFTYPDGNIRAIGYLQDGDTSLKVGKWQYYQNGEWKLTEIVYSKELTLSVLNEAYSYGKRPVHFKVLENGVWKQPILQNDNGAQTFYITDATDSILAYADSLSYSFRLPYQGLPDNIQKQFYLLKPGERTLKIGYYQMPFSTIRHHYAIIPDYSISRNPRQTTFQMTDSIISHLQKQYPKLAHVYISRNGRGISIESLSVDMRQKLLAQLKADKGIAFVSQLFSIAEKGTMTYCDNRVYVELKGNQPDSLKNAALALGFSNMQADMGYNRYWLTYESKIIDEGFFEAFKKLTELPWVMSAHFNHYMEQEPDAERVAGTSNFHRGERE